MASNDARWCIKWCTLSQVRTTTVRPRGHEGSTDHVGLAAAVAGGGEVRCCRVVVPDASEGRCRTTVSNAGDEDPPRQRRGGAEARRRCGDGGARTARGARREEGAAAAAATTAVAAAVRREMAASTPLAIGKTCEGARGGAGRERNRPNSRVRVRWKGEERDVAGENKRAVEVGGRETGRQEVVWLSSWSTARGCNRRRGRRQTTLPAAHQHQHNGRGHETGGTHGTLPLRRSQGAPRCPAAAPLCHARRSRAAARMSHSVALVIRGCRCKSSARRDSRGSDGRVGHSQGDRGPTNGSTRAGSEPARRRTRVDPLVRAGSLPHSCRSVGGPTVALRVGRITTTPSALPDLGERVERRAQAALIDRRLWHGASRRDDAPRVPAWAGRSAPEVSTHAWSPSPSARLVDRARFATPLPPNHERAGSWQSAASAGTAGAQRGGCRRRTPCGGALLLRLTAVGRRGRRGASGPETPVTVGRVLWEPPQWGSSAASAGPTGRVTRHQWLGPDSGPPQAAGRLRARDVLIG